MSATCKSCGAAIIWARTANGKAMPLDAKPERMFHITELPGPGGTQRDCTSVQVFRSHFSSCPQAAQHRSKQ